MLNVPDGKLACSSSVAFTPSPKLQAEYGTWSWQSLRIRCTTVLKSKQWQAKQTQEQENSEMKISNNNKSQ
jgi:hypothetical protein